MTKASSPAAPAKRPRQLAIPPGPSPSALIFPFAYSVEERFDLEHYMRPHHDDPDGVLTHWARQFMRTDGPTGELHALALTTKAPE